MAAIGMVQMLIEAAEYLDRRERGKVQMFCLLRFPLISEKSHRHPSPLQITLIYAPVISKPM